jgi:hypothetical protein
MADPFLAELRRMREMRAKLRAKLRVMQPDARAELLWTMLERFLQATRAEATIPQGNWLTPVELREVGPLRVFSVYPHDPMKDPVLVNIFYCEDGRTRPFKVDRDPAKDDRLVLVKIAPDKTARVIWKKHPGEWLMSILAYLALPPKVREADAAPRALN